MPGTISDGPSVALSFANNFWGKEDAGVEPLMQRMHNAKQTCDELKSFYAARAALEDDYARKLISLSRKPLGSQESGTLRASLDVLRGEVEQMGKSHQNIASQMKTELEEPLAAFAGAMKERRKIVQGGIEKLLKIKTQQTQHVNKTRDKYEQECLKIKGYLAQGHMVMGQEERKNKAKLEKTQINLATSNTEYENAVKALEETTGRWNRDWKAAADKFQDLEEERLDFTKSSLWSFANIASTVCVSDDASCEKVRLALENCEVEKDIVAFIKDRGTGQEIPDPPKYINFCRGDVSDSQSEASEDDSYSVAQFQRTINPAYRTSSPQPSTYESHHDPQSALARDLGHEPSKPHSREATVTPQKPQVDKSRQAQVEDYEPQPSRQPKVEDYEPPPQKQPQAEDYRPPQRQAQLEYQAPPARKQLDYQPPNPRRSSQPQPQAAPQALRKQFDHQPQQSRQPQFDYRFQPVRQHQPDYHSMSSRQPQLEYKPQPRQAQPEIEYKPQPRQVQPEIEYKPQPRQVQPEIEYKPQPRQVQPEIEYKPQPRQVQPEIEYKPQPRLVQPEIEYKPQPRQAQPEIEYKPQPRQVQPEIEYKLQPKQPQPEPRRHSRQLSYEQSQHGPLATVPHDPFPLDGMTMLCRTGPPSDRSSVNSPIRPSSRDSQSEYSNPTSFSSVEPTSEKTSPVKQVAPQPEKQVLKKKSGFFQSHSPFRRKSNKEKDHSTAITPSNRSTWSARSTTSTQNTPTRRPQVYAQSSQNMISDRPSGSPEPVDPRASFQLNVGNNVFDVAAPDPKKSDTEKDVDQEEEDLDPIAQALAELKGVTKASSTRISADKYHGVPTPAPGSTPSSRPAGTQMATGALMAGMRGTPPPSYDQPVQRLGLPQPAFTSKAMQQTRQKYVKQTQSIFSPPAARPDSSVHGSGSPSRPGTRAGDMPRATSPAPPRSVSPRPNTQLESRQAYRAPSPSPTTTHLNMQVESRQAFRAPSPKPASPPPSMQVESRQAFRAPSPKPASPRPSTQVEPRQAHRAPSPSPASAQLNMQVESRQAFRAPSPKPASPRLNMQVESRQAFRAPSPKPASPRPNTQVEPRQVYRAPSPKPASPRPLQADARQAYQSASPNAYAGSQRIRAQSSTPVKRGSDQTYYHHNSPNDITRAASPASFRDQERPSSSHVNDMSMQMQLAPIPDEWSGSQSGRGSRAGGSANSRAMSYYEGAQEQQLTARQRSQSVADVRQYSREGRPILHFARALYMYQAAIPEELSFAKGDILAVLRMQDDGWWEAEVTGQNGRPGLVPSNYLQNC